MMIMWGAAQYLYFLLLKSFTMASAHLATHPLIAHKVTLLRDQATPPHEFRRVLREITFYLGYEATRNLQLVDHKVETPNNQTAIGHKLSEKISFIPILRAGLGMTDGMLDLVPTASVHHIGMYRTKESLMPGRTTT
jgi:uracil phosphoribosyltransferase